MYKLVFGQGFQHPIPDLNKWIMSELMSYKDPPRLAHEIMIATFLLLGEEDADLMVILKAPSIDGVLKGSFRSAVYFG